ncbi:hypothetical protein P4S63_19290 [Pseudoalteromonas sp. B193]
MYSAEEVGLTQEKQLTRLNIAKILRVLLLNEVFGQDAEVVQKTPLKVMKRKQKSF